MAEDSIRFNHLPYDLIAPPEHRLTESVSGTARTLKESPTRPSSHLMTGRLRPSMCDRSGRLEWYGERFGQAEFLAELRTIERGIALGHGVAQLKAAEIEEAVVGQV